MKRLLIKLLGGISGYQHHDAVYKLEQKYKRLEEWVRETELETLRSGNMPARFLADRDSWGASPFMLNLWKGEFRKMYEGYLKPSRLSQLVMK